MAPRAERRFRVGVRLAACLTVLFIVVAYVPTGATVFLRIKQARGDLESGLLHITGENFGRKTTDIQVSLSGDLLGLVSLTNTEIVALMPPGTLPGTFRLVVIRTGLLPLADAMDVTLGSAG